MKHEHKYDGVTHYCKCGKYRFERFIDAKRQS